MHSLDVGFLLVVANAEIKYNEVNVYIVVGSSQNHNCKQRVIMISQLFKKMLNKYVSKIFGMDFALICSILEKSRESYCLKKYTLLLIIDIMMI